MSDWPTFSKTYFVYYFWAHHFCHVRSSVTALQPQGCA